MRTALCILAGAVGGWIVSQALTLAVCQMIGTPYGSPTGSALGFILGFIGGGIGASIALARWGES